METLHCPQGEFQLARYPARKSETLRAWDAADEYLLNHLTDEGILKPASRILILNDSFGALTVALAPHQPQMMGDSYLGYAGCMANAKANAIEEASLQLFTSTATLAGEYDLVLIKITKSLALLEDQLHRIRPHITADTAIVAGGMVKNIHTSTLKLFEKIIGATHTSLAKKKARLIFCQKDEALMPPVNPYPKCYPLESTDLQLVNHAGVFSRDSLDIGTRFMLEHLPRTQGEVDVIDLGCGNGALGIKLASENPQAHLTFTDESFMAVASAQAGFEQAFPQRQATFQANDCLAGIPANSADLILNNPPFHQQNVVGTHIANQMFRESKKVLRSGGELWVIGNRHLGYHVALKKLFGHCECVASNNKFVVLKAIKSKS